MKVSWLFCLWCFLQHLKADVCQRSPKLTMKLREWPISDNFFTVNEAGRLPWPRQYVCIFPHFNNILTMSRPSSSFHLFSFIIAWCNERREKKKCWRWPRPQQVNANWWRTDVSGLVCILYLQTAFASVSQVVHSSTHAKFPRISKGNMTADGQVASEGNVSEHRCNREPQKDLGCKELQRWSGANSPAMDTFH